MTSRCMRCGSTVNRVRASIKGRPRWALLETTHDRRYQHRKDRKPGRVEWEQVNVYRRHVCPARQLRAA